MQKTADKVYDKIVRYAHDLAYTGEVLAEEYGVPIINKRVSVTPISLIAESCQTDSYVPIAEAMDKAAKEIGINFIGGFSALVQKGMTKGDEVLLKSIPKLWPRRISSAPRSMSAAAKQELIWTRCA